MVPPVNRRRRAARRSAGRFDDAPARRGQRKEGRLIPISQEHACPSTRLAGPVRDRAIAISSMSSFPMTKSTTSGGAAMMLPRALIGDIHRFSSPEKLVSYFGLGSGNPATSRPITCTTSTRLSPDGRDGNTSGCDIEKPLSTLAGTARAARPKPLVSVAIGIRPSAGR